jgi:hypothetical protein
MRDVEMRPQVLRKTAQCRLAILRSALDRGDSALGVWRVDDRGCARRGFLE